MWQAGPSALTLSRIASPSQSSLSSSTLRKEPEVAPLCQSSGRERLQNQAWPLSRVRRCASSFIQASISTRPLVGVLDDCGALQLRPSLPPRARA